MKIIKNVQGTMSEITKMEYNGNRVYIRGNIEQITSDDKTCWQYDEIVMTISEYESQGLTDEKLLSLIS